MYKNQLQELAQRSCFNFPAYSCIREGLDHAPRFKATVNFSGETFESPTFCSTLRQAEHAAAEVALNTLAKQGPSRALAARVLDETGVYKSLLQETAHKAGLNLPVYTTIRSGRGHVPTFSCTVEIAGLNFAGDPARTKKQAQKNAAISAWSALRKLSQHHLSSLTPSSLPSESKGNEEREQVIIAQVLSSLLSSESKKISESDHHHRLQKSNTTSPVSSLPTPGMYPPQCQHCGYSSFFPDVTMYQIWQQEQIIQQQKHILTLTVPQTIPPVPHIYPLVQPVLQPDHCLYFPARDMASVPAGPKFSIATSRPPFCFANQIVPGLRGTSTVTIREIQEEKEEDPPVCNFSNETRVPTPAPEDEIQKHGGSESRSKNVQLGGEQSGTSDWASYWRIGSAYRPVNTELQNPSSIDTSCPILRAHSKASSNGSFRPPAAASSMMRTSAPTSSAVSRPQHGEAPLAVPSRMRTGVPGCPSMPKSERFGMVGAPTPRFMAPAVRIRSIVPVCSANPRRSIEVASKSEEKGGLKTEVESRISSELGNL